MRSLYPYKSNLCTRAKATTPIKGQKGNPLTNLPTTIYVFLSHSGQFPTLFRRTQIIVDAYVNMSELSAINYLFLNRNFGAVPAGEPFHNCIIIPVSSGSFTDSFAKVHIFINNPSCNFFKMQKQFKNSLVMLSLPSIFAKKPTNRNFTKFSEEIY